MQILISSQKIVIDQDAREHIERRVQFALSRFGDRVVRVRVRLADINGPRGGDDKSCSIEIRLRPSARVYLQDTDANLFAVIDRVIERAERTVARKIDKMKPGRQPKPFIMDDQNWRGDDLQEDNPQDETPA